MERGGAVFPPLFIAPLIPAGPRPSGANKRARTMEDAGAGRVAAGARQGHGWGMAGAWQVRDRGAAGTREEHGRAAAGVRQGRGRQFFFQSTSL